MTQQEKDAIYASLLAAAIESSLGLALRDFGYTETFTPVDDGMILTDGEIE